ncbi:MAG: tyrosine--tRNA ligase [Coprobacillus sp.]|nr:tyrosine--tRNA ligase [Coprobacillus sp.]MDY4144900.1 tyrosine--tRNA ligase [Bacilli bacterium]CCY07190.1 tyrosine--tRNA ligase [Coprobacillus sp. CAG:698]
MNLFKVLKERNLLYQATDEELLEKLLTNEKVTVYCGTDPTADSLHIGHCIPCTILRRFQQAGHKVIILVGGATAAIGDPTGKTDMRPMLSKEQLESNINSMKRAYSKFLNFEGDNPAIIVNNADWFKGYDYVDFMRNVGVHFNVNKMMANEIYAKRIKEGGLTFFEMGYMLMQAYDFVHLNESYGCNLQWGGADQWGNIVAGVELARKLNYIDNKNRVMVGATNPLLLTPEGKKMGKTERGAIWIDNDKISAFDFYQGIYQTPDACVEMMFALFTDIPMDEVREMIKTDIVKCKKRLSFEITKFIRGEKDAIEAENMTNNLFYQANQSKENAPVYEIELEENDINVIDLIFEAKFITSKSEARRLIASNGLSMDGKLITDISLRVTKEELKEGILFKKGKKAFLNIKLK